MIEYPPQTSLPFIAHGWKCLLVAKLIESCSRIKHKMNCILSNNAVGETSYKFEHSLTGWFILKKKLPFIQLENVGVANL